MNSVRKLLCLVTILLIPSFSWSQTATRGYGQAGCGLGSLVFGSQKGPVQILAATLNFTGGNTFAMSSGTSNCKPVFGRDATDFIDANRMTLANDIARGNGETIQSLATIYRCQNSEALSMVLKRNYGEIFSSPSKHSAAINESIINLIRNNSTTKCDILS